MSYFAITGFCNKFKQRWGSMKNIKKKLNYSFVRSCSVLSTVLCPCFMYECNKLCLKKETGMRLERDRMPSVQAKSFVKFIQGDQKVSVHLMITIQKVTSNIQSVPLQFPDIY
jgi:hypothetical protein